MNKRWAKYTFQLAIAVFVAGQSIAASTPAITFYEREEAIPEGAVKLRTITLTGNDPARGCAYYELQQLAQDSAIKMGANLIHEDAKKDRTRLTPCDEVTFSFYRIGDVHAAEQRFSWSADRPLIWSDFKGGIPNRASDKTAAETSCGIGIETNTVTTTNQPKVYVYNTFQTNTSWVRSSDSTADILEHEQGHWDLCELYTRKMRERFSRAHIDVYNLHQVVDKIFNETQREYAQKQEQYEQETEHGIIREQQQRWTAMLRKELRPDQPK